MTDRETVIKGLEMCRVGHCDYRCPYASINVGCKNQLLDDAIALLKNQGQTINELKDCLRNIVKDAKELLKEHEAVKPKVTSSEQRCGNCNKVIEMDGWKSCPWCGKPIAWSEWWNENGGQAVK